jgi:hypothetical protein
MTTDVKMPSKTLLKERLADAELKAKSPTIEKQSLVIEALKLLYMARGKPGSPSYALDELVLTGAPPRPRRGSKRPR